MTREQFLEIAEKKWIELEKIKNESNGLFDYEKDFDELWVDFGRLTLEGTLSKKINDRRKKKNNKPLWENRDEQHS